MVLAQPEYMCVVLGVSHLRGCGSGAHPGVGVAGRGTEEPVPIRDPGQVWDPGPQG